MAQKPPQISLSAVQKDILSEALNLIYHGEKSRSKKLIRLGDNLIQHLLIDPRITEAYQEFVQSFVPDEDFSIQEALDQLDFIEERFYSTTGTAGADVMFVRRHRAQKADELINRKAGANLLENRYGTGLLWSFRLFFIFFHQQLCHENMFQTVNSSSKTTMRNMPTHGFLLQLNLSQRTNVQRDLTCGSNTSTDLCPSSTCVGGQTVRAND